MDKRKKSILIQEKQSGSLTYYRKKVLIDNYYTLEKDVKLLSYIYTLNLAKGYQDY